MSNSEGFTSSLADLESVQSTTICMRREYSKKITSLHSKTLDLRFDTLIKTKHLLDINENELSKQVPNSNENNIDLSLIKEPLKINVSFLQENDKMTEINEALNTWKLIDEVKQRLNSK